MIKEEAPSEDIDEIESIADGIDELIGDDLEEIPGDKNAVEKIKSSVKIAGDEDSGVIKDDS